MRRIPARRQVLLRPLTGALIHRVMAAVFPRRHDYVGGQFDELVAELAALGISSRGEFRRMMLRRRRALVRADRARLPLWEQHFYVEDLGKEFVADALRRQYWFSYPALVRIAMDMELGERIVEVPDAARDTT